MTAVIAVIPQWRGELFYYVGDQNEQFAPLWHILGTSLRAGEWTPMDPSGWMGGNYAAEALTGIWNPVNVINFVIVSFFDNLSLGAFVVMVEMLAILSVGAYLLMREYGAGRTASVLLATAVPVTGFTLWYEASGWPAGLMAFTWVTHFWWSSRRFSRGLLNPFVPFVFGFLAMTTGNPYAPLGMVVVLAAIAVELIIRRDMRMFRHLVVMGAAVGAIALVVFLPLLGSSSVTLRQELAQIANDTFLVPDLGDLAAGSSPTYLPSMSNWGGARLENVPSTYFAWFVIPLLPWLRWGSLYRRFAGSVSLFVVAGFYLIATLAPSNLWLFRWPVRLVEYFYLACAVLFAVALSAGLGRDHFRRRAWTTAGLIGFGFYLAWAVRPESDYSGIHLVGLVVVAALVAGALYANSRWGIHGLGVVGVAGTALVLFLQTSLLPVQQAGGTPVYAAYDLSRIEAGTDRYEGTVLQIAQLDGVTTDQMRDGEILFGNLPRAAGIKSVASYTGMGFLDFATELCMDYRGATCPEAFDRLWLPVGDDIPIPLVDAMRVSTLVLQNSMLPDVVGAAPYDGWRVLQRTPVRTVWVREDPLPEAGLVSWVSPGIAVESDVSESRREVVDYSAAEPGTVLWSRLAWPGYSATVDGNEVEAKIGPAGLLAVDVPAGDHRVVVEYTSPGMKLGLVAALAAIVLVLVQSILWMVGRRRTRADQRVQ